MKTYRTLVSLVLMTFIGACSDSAQFTQATTPAPLNAERIINPDPSATDPSADANAPGGANDPSMVQVDEAGNPIPGTGGSGTGSTGGLPGAGGTSTGSTGGSTTVGAGGTAKSPEATAAAVEELKATCNAGVKKTLKKSIHFPEVRTCAWEMNGNLGRLNGHVQAIEGQRATIELPANAHLCELGIGSVATTIQYDDFMLLTLNNQVLLSSNKELLQGLQADQTFAWDFSKVRGKAIDFDAAPYCLGDNSLCKIPVTDVQGSFQFSIDPNSLGKLAANSANKKNLDFALYATGDNDDRDCWHTAFTLDFTLNYVE